MRTKAEAQPPLVVHSAERNGRISDRLSTSPNLGEDAVLPVLDAIDELRRWAEFARTKAWTNANNHRQLRTEIKASLESIGPNLRGYLVQQIGSLEDDLATLLGRTTYGARDTIAERCRAFAARMRTDDGLRLAFQDVLDTADDDLQEGKGSLSALKSILGARGLDARRVLSSASSILDEDGFESWLALTELGELDPSTSSPESNITISPQDRLELVQGLLLSAPQEHHCVAWLQFRSAHIRSRRIDAGPVTFLSAGEVIHNALESDAADGEFANEVRELFRYKKDGVDYASLAEKWVSYARVDLGRRRRHGAMEAAEDLTSTMLELAVAQTNGVQWTEFGVQTLLVDGHALDTSGAAVRFDARREREDDVSGMNQTAEGLATWGRHLGRTSIEGSIPEYLAEAIAIHSQTRQIRWSEGPRFQENRQLASARTLIALEDRVVELIGSYTQEDPGALSNYAFKNWTAATWHFELRGAIRHALNEGRANLDEDAIRKIKFAIFTHTETATSISYPTASENENALIEMCAPGLGRLFLQTRLASLRDASVYSQLHATYEADRNIYAQRLRRVRNAVVHGNPVVDSAISSSVELSRWVVDSVMRHALEQFTTGKPIAEIYNDEEIQDAAAHERIARGESWLDIWKVPSTPHAKNDLTSAGDAV